MEWLFTFLVSMLPVIELRGAIPYGVEKGLTLWQAYSAGLAGSILSAVTVLALFIPVFRLVKKIKFLSRFADFAEKRISRQAGKIKYTYFSLFVFVLVPIPLTGVWTGAAVAMFLGLNYWKSLWAISFGAAACGLFMVVVTLLFGDIAVWIFYFFGAAAIITIGVFLILALSKKPHKETVTHTAKNTVTPDTKKTSAE